MSEINTYNIPAFQRKRSLAAKSRQRSKLNLRLAKSKSRPADNKELFTDIPLNETLPEEDLFNKRKPIGKADLQEFKKCGIIEGYFDKIQVAIIKVTSAIRKGDLIILEKDDGVFIQPLNSIQIDRKDVKIARAGGEIGIKVLMKPMVGGSIYKEL